MAQRILIIEDEPGIAENIGYALGTEGFENVWCATGGEGEKRLEEERFDLVLLDVGLPDQNGFDLCRRLRLKSAVPVIFLTARHEEVDRVVGLEIGADDYISKPFSPRELTARVRAVLRRTHSGTPHGGPQAAVNGRFEVDEERKRILYHGEALNLSRYEYRLLAALIRRPGRVFSRDELMTHACDEPEASLDRTVDVHVKNIRGKLRAIAADEDPILTHRGMGYSLRE